MSVTRNKKHEVIHWAIFVIFAISVSIYLLSYTQKVEGRLDEIAASQIEMLELLRADNMDI